jgi:hypothetical protein
MRQGPAPDARRAACEQESDETPSIDVVSHATRIRNPMSLFLEVFRFYLLSSTLDFRACFPSLTPVPLWRDADVGVKSNAKAMSR